MFGKLQRYREYWYTCVSLQKTSSTKYVSIFSTQLVRDNFVCSLETCLGVYGLTTKSSTFRIGPRLCTVAYPIVRIPTAGLVVQIYKAQDFSKWRNRSVWSAQFHKFHLDRWPRESTRIYSLRHYPFISCVVKLSDHVSQSLLCWEESLMRKIEKLRNIAIILQDKS